jgi:hypothetical protein
VEYRNGTLRRFLRDSDTDSRDSDTDSSNSLWHRDSSPNGWQAPLIFYLKSGIVPGSPSVKIGVTENLVLNDPTKVIGVTPNLPGGKTWYIKIRTRYAGNGPPSEKPAKSRAPSPCARCEIRITTSPDRESSVS